MKTQFISCLGALACVALLQSAHAETIAGVAMPALWPATDLNETFWGTKVADPYRALENTKDPLVGQWMRKQADATTSILEKIPGRSSLLQRIQENDKAVSGSASQIRRSQNGRWFYLKRDPQDNQFRLVWRQGPQGEEKLLVDPEQQAKRTGTPHAIMDYAPSPDGLKLAYAIQAGGGEIGVLHVIDVESGKELITPVDGIRYASAAWLDDSSGFFYSRLREGYQQLPAEQRLGDSTRYFHSLLAPEKNRVIFSPSRSPNLALPSYAFGYIAQIPGTRKAVLSVHFGVDRNLALYLADLDAVLAGQADWKKIVGQENKVVQVQGGGDWIYLRSSENAPNYKLMRMPLAAPVLAQAELVNFPGSGVIADMDSAQDALYVSRRAGVNTQLFRVPHAAKLEVEPMVLPFEGSVKATTEATAPGATLHLAAWTRTTQIYHYDPATRSTAALDLVKKGRLDAPPGLVSREVLVKSHDGVMVPMSLVHRADLVLNGNNPTILYGYGAYGSFEDPFLSPGLYSWIERGGIYAFSHVRGGGVYGSQWHEAGKKTTKPNTWKDAIAAAQWLIEQKYSSAKRLAIYGGSAGGILVGRAITERPDLFAAAVPAVGVMDAMRMEFEANGVANVPEFGTVKKEDEFRALLEMSAYHALKAGQSYPATLLLHGVNDLRVDVWQSSKFAARLRAVQPNPNPVLMRLDYQSGHGQGGTRSQNQMRTADMYSFLLWQFGDAAFQPRGN